MSKCESCRHAIFDAVWGEYKCKITKIVMYKTVRRDCSGDFEPKEKGE
jgi:hypothetical protein